MINILKKVQLHHVILSTILFALSIVFLLPAMDAASGSIMTPDSDFWYNSKRLLEIKTQYTPIDISAYISTRFTYDVLWPLVYGFYLLSTIAYLAKWIKNNTLLLLLYSLPVLGLFFDYLENIICSLYFSDILIATTGLLAPIMSSLKWLIIFACFINQGVLFIIYIKRKLKTT